MGIRGRTMSQGMINIAYIGATILFILALGGLSNQETARRGNYYGMIGMGIALIATIAGIVTANYVLLIIAVVIGAVVGLILAKKSCHRSKRRKTRKKRKQRNCKERARKK